MKAVREFSLLKVDIFLSLDVVCTNGMTVPWYGKPLLCVRENIQRHLEEFKQGEKEIDHTWPADYLQPASAICKRGQNS